MIYDSSNFLHRDIANLADNGYSNLEIANELESPEKYVSQVVAAYFGEMQDFFLGEDNSDPQTPVRRIIPQ